MKSRKMTLVLALFVAAALLASALLAGTPKKELDTSPHDVRYTLLCTLTGGYWDEIASGALDEAERLGVSVKCITFDYSEETYLANVRYAAQTGIDGMIVSGGARSAALVREYEKMREQGMSVVYTDAHYPEANIDAFICSDNVEGGRLAAKALAEATGEQANILIVAYSTTARTQTERMKGFREAIEAYPGMQVVDVIADKGDSLLLQKEVERVMAAYPHIDAIFSVGESGSNELGKCPAIKDRLGSEIKVVSFDMNDSIASHIKEGLYAATIAQSPYQMGVKSIQTMEAIRAGKPIEEKLIHTDLTIVTQKNLDDHLQSGGGEVIWNRY